MNGHVMHSPLSGDSREGGQCSNECANECKLSIRCYRKSLIIPRAVRLGRKNSKKRKDSFRGNGLSDRFPMMASCQKILKNVGGDSFCVMSLYSPWRCYFHATYMLTYISGHVLGSQRRSIAQHFT